MLKQIVLFCILALTAWPAYAGQAPSVFGATFTSTFSLYALNPDLLAGWNGPLREYEKKYIPQKYQDLPILGGWYGQGFIPDREILRQRQIDEAFFVYAGYNHGADIEKELKKIGIPVRVKVAETVDDYIGMFRELGTEYGIPERGEALAAFSEKTLANVQTMVGNIPKEQRVRVYIAQDADGLGTVCASSQRSEAVTLAGGINVHTCPQAFSESPMKIPFEQIMLYDPDVIVALHPLFMDRVGNDSRWQTLRAAQEGKVFFSPHEPFSWLDKPASFMRVMGVQWLACKLYPEHCSHDMVSLTQDFLRLFFNVETDEEGARVILKE